MIVGAKKIKIKICKRWDSNPGDVVNHTNTTSVDSD